MQFTLTSDENSRTFLIKHFFPGLERDTLGQSTLNIDDAAITAKLSEFINKNELKNAITLLFLNTNSGEVFSKLTDDSISSLLTPADSENLNSLFTAIFMDTDTGPENYIRLYTSWQRVSSFSSNPEAVVTCIAACMFAGRKFELLVAEAAAAPAPAPIPATPPASDAALSQAPMLSSSAQSNPGAAAANSQNDSTWSATAAHARNYLTPNSPPVSPAASAFFAPAATAANSNLLRTREAKAWGNIKSIQHLHEFIQYLASNSPSVSPAISACFTPAASTAANSIFFIETIQATWRDIVSLRYLREFIETTYLEQPGPPDPKDKDQGKIVWLSSEICITYNKTFKTITLSLPSPTPSLSPIQVIHTPDNLWVVPPDNPDRKIYGTDQQIHDFIKQVWAAIPPVWFFEYFIKKTVKTYFWFLDHEREDHQYFRPCGYDFVKDASKNLFLITNPRIKIKFGFDGTNMRMLKTMDGRPFPQISTVDPRYLQELYEVAQDFFFHTTAYAAAKQSSLAPTRGPAQ